MPGDISDSGREYMSLEVPAKSAVMGLEAMRGVATEAFGTAGRERKGPVTTLTASSGP